jgi:aryl-alcohol dehydrogenase-like predicted oxidoreductase
METLETRRLGRTDIEITPIGLGCMQFSSGSGLIGRTFTHLPQERVTKIVKAAVDGGIGWFDTAEMYGRGHSERVLATGLKESGVAPGEVVVATKWLPMLRTAGHLPRSIDVRLEALKGYPIDLYMIHLPVGGLSSIRSQVRAMARLLKDGKIRSVGVSNFSARQMIAAHEVLTAEGVTLAANQVQVSLLRREIKRNGVLDAARRLGVTLIAYSPLALGALTGRFHDDPGAFRALSAFRRIGMRGFLGGDGLARTAPLIDELRGVAEAHGVTVAQVAMNWVVSYYGDTVVAIPGASKPRQATEAAGAMGFRLTDRELARIDEVSRRMR